MVSTLRANASFLLQYFRQELRPYPGRASLVARMTLTAVLVMLWVMTFHIPNATLGVYYTLLITRESLSGTLRDAWRLLIVVIMASAVVLIGVSISTGSPFFRFLFVTISLIIGFFFVSAARDYRSSVTFGAILCAGIPAWDLPASPELALHSFLYGVLSIVVGAMLAFAVELAWALFFGSSDNVEQGTDARLDAVQTFLNQVPSVRTEVMSTLSQFADVGTGSLRRELNRRLRPGDELPIVAARVVLSGRMIDMADLLAKDSELLERYSAVLNALGNHLKSIRSGIVAKDMSFMEVDTLPEPVCILRDSIVELGIIKSGLLDTTRYDIAAPVERWYVLREGWSCDPEHIRFALRGSLAAMSCYVFYHLVDWKGLSVAISTCMLTALSTTGSSRQKQMLRLFGALTGGLLLGLGSIIFLFPYFDSLGIFTLLFAGVTALGAWIATASPRVSYLGLQIIFSFYLCQLLSFGPTTQLTTPRDQVCGILLGLAAMWLFFDRWRQQKSAPAMRRQLIQALQVLAKFLRVQPQKSSEAFLREVRIDRDNAHIAISQLRTTADAALFEFDRDRDATLRLREWTRSIQVDLRTLLAFEIGIKQAELLSITSGLEAAASTYKVDGKIADVMEEAALVLAGTKPAGDLDLLSTNLQQLGMAESSYLLSSGVKIAQQILKGLMEHLPDFRLQE